MSYILTKMTDIIEFNPREFIAKKQVCKKVPMEYLQPFTRQISGYKEAPYAGGTKFRNNDTIMARITPCLENGKTALIKGFAENEVIFGSTEYIVMRAISGSSDPTFIYYLATSSSFREVAIKSMVGSSGRQRVQQDILENLELVLPDYETQVRVGKVLASFDDKIELNAQINHNLEEQAKAIFREYFQPHEKVVPLGSICKCVLGGTPNRNKSEFWGGDIPWINSGKVNEFRITTASEYITDSGLKNSSTKLLPCHTTVIAITGATLGQVSLLEIASCANQSVVGVLQNDNVPYTFIYPFIKENILELISNQTGGAQQHINKQNVEALPVPCYSPDLISEYHEKISPLYGQISNNCFESERLTGLRDLLLPKLMSGEIDVSEVEI